MHEITHLDVRPGCDGVCYTVNLPSIEASVIRRINEFMMNHYDEPYRMREHGAVVNE